MLPGDAAHYTTLEIDRRAARAGGGAGARHPRRPPRRVDLHPVRADGPAIAACACAPRSSTAATTPRLWALVDGYYWCGPRGAALHARRRARASPTPSFSLLTINDAYATVPVPRGVGALQRRADQLHRRGEVHRRDDGGLPVRDQVSAAGMKRTIVPPRGYDDLRALHRGGRPQGRRRRGRPGARGAPQVLGEKVVTLTGKVERPGRRAPRRRARGEHPVIARARWPTPVEKRTPWTQVGARRPTARSAPRCRPARSYVVEVARLRAEGRSRRTSPPLAADTDLGTFTLPSTATVHLQRAGRREPSPSTRRSSSCPPTRRPRPRWPARCTAASPPARRGWARRRARRRPATGCWCRTAPATAEVPVGHFYVYAFHGPVLRRWAARLSTVTAPATQTAHLHAAQLALQPAGTLSADFHVHGAASFDSSHPRPRSRALVLRRRTRRDRRHRSRRGRRLRRAGRRRSGCDQRMTAVTGVETTGHIPFLRHPELRLPAGDRALQLLAAHATTRRCRATAAPSTSWSSRASSSTRTKAALRAARRSSSSTTPGPTRSSAATSASRARSRSTCAKDLPTDDDGTSAGIFVRTPDGGAHLRQRRPPRAGGDERLRQRPATCSTARSGSTCSTRGS